MNEFGDLVKIFGLPTAIFVAIIVAGYRKKWCYGWQLSDALNERDYWRNQCMTLLSTTRQVVSTAQTAVQKLPDPINPPVTGGQG